MADPHRRNLYLYSAHGIWAGVSLGMYDRPQYVPVCNVPDLLHKRCMESTEETGKVQIMWESSKDIVKNTAQFSDGSRAEYGKKAMRAAKTA